MQKLVLGVPEELWLKAVSMISCRVSAEETPSNVARVSQRRASRRRGQRPCASLLDGPATATTTASISASPPRQVPPPVVAAPAMPACLWAAGGCLAATVFSAESDLMSGALLADPTQAAVACGRPQRAGCKKCFPVLCEARNRRQCQARSV